MTKKFFSGLEIFVIAYISSKKLVFKKIFFIKD